MTFPAATPHLDTAVGNLFVEATVGQHLRDVLPVAGNAIVLNSSGSITADAKIVPIGFEGHGNGMIIAVPCLGQHLIDK